MNNKNSATESNKIQFGNWVCFEEVTNSISKNRFFYIRNNFYHSLATIVVLAAMAFMSNCSGSSSSQSVSSGSGSADSTAPTLTIVTIGSSNADTTMAKTDDTITLSITSSESITTPIVTIAGKTANVSGSDSSYTASITVVSSDTQGAAAIDISSYSDLAGNSGSVVTSTTDSSSVTIDTAMPANQDIVLTGSSAVQGGSIAINPPGAGFTVWLAPAGTTVFAAGVEMTSVQGASSTISVPSVDGVYFLYIINSAGNVSAASAAAITVDNVPPNAPALTGITAGSFNTNKTFTVTGSGGGLQYSTNGGTTWSNYSTSVTLSAENSYAITARETDAAGNVSGNAATINVTIDKTAPNAPTVVGIAAGSFNTNKTFTVTGSGGVLQYSTNGGTTWSNYTTAVTLSAENSYTITARETDAAGNVSGNATTINVTIDKTAPNAPAITGITAGSFNTNQSFTLTGTGGSLEYSTNGGTTWSAYTTVVTLSVENSYAITARETDAAGNVSGNAATINVTIDKTAPVFSGTVPASNAYVTHTQISYTLSETITSGTITWTRTGGAADAGTHVQNLTGAELDAGPHSNITLTNAPTLVSEAVYSITFDGVDAAGNAATSVVVTGVMYDTTAPTLTSVSIVSSNAVNTVAASGDTITLSITASESITTPVVTLAGKSASVSGSGTSYSATITASSGDTQGPVAINISGYNDLAGNSGSAVTTTTNTSAVSIDTAPPIIVSAETMDANGNGKIDHYKITFSKPVKDSSFPGYVLNGGSAQTDWLVSGYAGVKIAHGTSSPAGADIANDSIIYLTFTEGSLADTGAKPDLTTTVTPGLTDSIGNALAQIGTVDVVEKDTARPIVAAAAGMSTTTARVTFSEVVTAATAEVFGNYDITPLTVSGANMYPTTGQNSDKVLLTTSNQIAGQNYTMTLIDGSVLDMAGNGTFAASAGFSGVYTVVATVSGLTGTLVLQNNGADDLTIAANGAFQFVTGLANGGAYRVTVKNQPTNQGCTFANNVGTIAGASANVTVTCVTSGTEDTVSWNKVIDTGIIEDEVSVATDSAGNVYVIGNKCNLSFTDKDWWIKKFNSAGVEDTVNWNKTISSGVGSLDYLNDIVIDSSDNVYVVGSGINLVNSTSGYDWWIKKFSSTGVEDTVNWNKSFNSAGTNSDIARSIAVDSTGNIYIAGYGTNLVNGTSGNDWWVKKFSSSGVEDTTNWNKSFNSTGTNGDTAWSIAVDSTDNIYIAGYGTNLVNGTSGNDWWVKKFSSSGVEDTTNWNKSFSSTGTNSDWAWSIAVDSTGNIYIAGSGINLVNGTSGNDWWIKKFSSTGVEDTVNWNKSFSSTGTNFDFTKSIAVDSASNIYIAGYGANLVNGTSGTDWWVKKFSSSGVEDTVNWNKSFSSAGTAGEDATGITSDKFGYLYVVGTKKGGTSDWWLKKFTP